MDIRGAFGLTAYPFRMNLKPKELYMRPYMDEIRDRITFAASSGLYFVMTREVGAGKSTAMDYALSTLPQKSY